MKSNLNKATAATFVVAVAVLSGLTSCKGRTMDNMEPTGETIEVNIVNPSTVEASADTALITDEVSAHL